jgi:hypothetical protein
MDVVPLINLNAYVLDVADIDNRLISKIILSSNQKPDAVNFPHTYFEDIVLPGVPEIYDLCKKISSVVSSVLNREYSVESIWGLILNRGESVGMHSHKSNSHLYPSEFYSIVYYPSVPEGSAEIVFSLTHCNTIEQSISIKPKEGMLIIFNSYISHMTSRHMSDESRIVISANLCPLEPNTKIVPDWSPYRLIGNNGGIDVCL